MLPYTSELAELKTIPEYILFFKAKTQWSKIHGLHQKQF